MAAAGRPGITGVRLLRNAAAPAALTAMPAATKPMPAPVRHLESGIRHGRSRLTAQAATRGAA